MMRNSIHVIGRSAAGAALVLSFSLCASPARSQEAVGELEQRAPTRQLNEEIAPKGAFLPLSHAATIVGQRAYGVALGGYDGARETGSFEASAEVRVWGPLALRAGAVYVNSGRSLRPSVGGRFQGLREGVHGVDGAVGVFYRPEGLTEPEGEIETIVSIGRHVGATYLLGNLAYGQDPEGNERDGEVRAAVLRPFGERVVMGFDGRLRFDLGSSAAKLAANHEATLDALIGPTAAFFVGPLALLANAGGSAVRFQGATTKYGAFVLAGAGTAF